MKRKSVDKLSVHFSVYLFASRVFSFPLVYKLTIAEEGVSPQQKPHQSVWGGCHVWGLLLVN